MSMIPRFEISLNPTLDPKVFGIANACSGHLIQANISYAQGNIVYGAGAYMPLTYTGNIPCNVVAGNPAPFTFNNVNTGYYGNYTVSYGQAMPAPILRSCEGKVCGKLEISE